MEIAAVASLLVAPEHQAKGGPAPKVKIRHPQVLGGLQASTDRVWYASKCQMSFQQCAVVSMLLPVPTWSPVLG